LSADKVLVTGVSGFVGSAVARALLARGLKVTALVRASSPRTNLDGLPFDVAVGDMTDQASVQAAARGARYLFHVAADYRIWARDPEEIVRANREGTAAVMRAAKAVGVERIVYTSSVATLGVAPGADRNVPADETHPLTPETAVGAYKRSKVIAERLVEQMVAEEGLPAVIVNPSTPIGPRDVKPTPTGRIIVEAAASGARYLFHVAADYRMWARDPEEIVRANREGTGAVMRAAKAVGVERIVYTSSVATLGPPPGGDKNAPADETWFNTVKPSSGR